MISALHRFSQTLHTGTRKPIENTKVGRDRYKFRLHVPQSSALHRRHSHNNRERNGAGTNPDRSCLSLRNLRAIDEL